MDPTLLKEAPLAITGEVIPPLGALPHELFTYFKSRGRNQTPAENLESLTQRIPRPTRAQYDNLPLVTYVEAENIPEKSLPDRAVESVKRPELDERILVLQKKTAEIELKRKSVSVTRQFTSNTAIKLRGLSNAVSRSGLKSDKIIGLRTQAENLLYGTDANITQVLIREQNKPISEEIVQQQQHFLTLLETTVKEMEHLIAEIDEGVMRLNDKVLAESPIYNDVNSMMSFSTRGVDEIIRARSNQLANTAYGVAQSLPEDQDNLDGNNPNERLGTAIDRYTVVQNAKAAGENLSDYLNTVFPYNVGGRDIQRYVRSNTQFQERIEDREDKNKGQMNEALGIVLKEGMYTDNLHKAMDFYLDHPERAKANLDYFFDNLKHAKDPAFVEEIFRVAEGTDANLVQKLLSVFHDDLVRDAENITFETRGFAYQTLDEVFSYGEYPEMRSQLISALRALREKNATSDGRSVDKKRDHQKLALLLGKIGGQEAYDALKDDYFTNTSNSTVGETYESLSSEGQVVFKSLVHVATLTGKERELADDFAGQLVQISKNDKADYGTSRDILLYLKQFPPETYADQIAEYIRNSRSSNSGAIACEILAHLDSAGQYTADLDQFVQRITQSNGMVSFEVAQALNATHDAKFFPIIRTTVKEMSARWKIEFDDTESAGNDDLYRGRYLYLAKSSLDHMPASLIEEEMGKIGMFDSISKADKLYYLALVSGSSNPQEQELYRQFLTDSSFRQTHEIPEQYAVSAYYGIALEAIEGKRSDSKDLMVELLKSPDRTTRVRMYKSVIDLIKISDDTLEQFCKVRGETNGQFNDPDLWRSLVGLEESYPTTIIYDNKKDVQVIQKVYSMGEKILQKVIKGERYEEVFGELHEENEKPGSFFQTAEGFKDTKARTAKEIPDPIFAKIQVDYDDLALQYMLFGEERGLVTTEQQIQLRGELESTIPQFMTSVIPSNEFEEEKFRYVVDVDSDVLSNSFGVVFHGTSKEVKDAIITSPQRALQVGVRGYQGTFVTSALSIAESYSQGRDNVSGAQTGEKGGMLMFLRDGPISLHEGYTNFNHVPSTISKNGYAVDSENRYIRLGGNLAFDITGETGDADLSKALRYIKIMSSLSSDSPNAQELKVKMRKQFWQRITEADPDIPTKIENLYSSMRGAGYPEAKIHEVAGAFIEQTLRGKIFHDENAQKYTTILEKKLQAASGENGYDVGILHDTMVTVSDPKQKWSEAFAEVDVLLPIEDIEASMDLVIGRQQTREFARILDEMKQKGSKDNPTLLQKYTKQLRVLLRSESQGLTKREFEPRISDHELRVITSGVTQDISEDQVTEELEYIANNQQAIRLEFMQLARDKTFEDLKPEEKKILEKYRVRYAFAAVGSIGQKWSSFSSDQDYVIVIDDDHVDLKEKTQLENALDTWSKKMNRGLRDFGFIPDAGLANEDANPIIRRSEVSKLSLDIQSDRQIIEPTNITAMVSIDGESDQFLDVVKREMLNTLDINKVSDKVSLAEFLEIGNVNKYVLRWFKAGCQLYTGDSIHDLKKDVSRLFAMKVDYFFARHWYQIEPHVGPDKLLPSDLLGKINLLEEVGALTPEQSHGLYFAIQDVYRLRLRSDIYSQGKHIDKIHVDQSLLTMNERRNLMDDAQVINGMIDLSEKTPDGETISEALRKGVIIS